MNVERHALATALVAVIRLRADAIYHTAFANRATLQRASRRALSDALAVLVRGYAPHNTGSTKDGAVHLEAVLAVHVSGVVALLYARHAASRLPHPETFRARLRP